ncbi:saccharopine dehydrogenase-like oxidoreductase [Coccinella septempunctata]|uniref:saccharopine dehydrogenase-like oxidoreductase n=1 Tax=Coccinella septempunctata TaxID=41139 RepID=UPI001D08A303|nr:saccharopine dehydrogenase-like oxidoreductase [Coccinella septempunctata]
MAQKLDIILLGATGFTGQYVLRELHKHSRSKGRNLTWGVAGRNEISLRKALQDLAEETQDPRLTDQPIIIADLQDPKSVKEMASKARLVINCCGPYRFLGETVVKACVEEGTHHVDVSGEPYYMESMQLKYDEEARRKNIYVVSACGVDSIPADLGVAFLEKNFNGGTLNSVETYFQMSEGGGPFSRQPESNYGTWESAVHEVGHVGMLRPLRTELFKNKLPKLKPTLGRRFLPFKSPIDGQWAAFFPGPDRSVVYRSQYYFYEEEHKRPIQIQTYLLINSFITMILLGIIGAMFTTFARVRLGRYLLLKYPRFFSMGMFANTKQKPSKEKIEKTKFCLSLVGKGWPEKSTNPDDKFKGPPQKGVIVQVKGSNPVYGITSKCMVLASIMILTEPFKMPQRGGVYPPGAAFAKTSLMEELNENGVTFEVLKEFNIAG